MENNNQSFWQFSDQLRDQSNNNLANLSLNDSIWGNSYGSKKPERRNFDTRVNLNLQAKNELEPVFRNFENFESNVFKGKEEDLNSEFKKFDIRVGGELNNSSNAMKKEVDFNGFNHSWKIGGSDLNGFSNNDWKSNNSGFNKSVFSNSMDYNLNLNNNLNNINLNLNKKGYYKKNEDVNNSNHHGFNKFGKKNKNNSNKDSNKESENNNNKDNKNSVEKRFKTLPPSEALPRNETIGGYIFVCNNDTMQENLQRQLFGLPPRYRDSVRSITPGLPLFLYNYSTHQLHGIYEAASFGGTNIDPSAWEDKKNPGESRFPAQVRVMTRKISEPLEEDSFRPILHHYDGPKFRLELDIPEALALLDIFSAN